MTEDLVESRAKSMIERYVFHFVNGKELTIDSLSVMFNSDERIYQLFNRDAKRFVVNFDKVLYVETKTLNKDIQ